MLPRQSISEKTIAGDFCRLKPEIAVSFYKV